jgi:hypothetical protein
VPAKRGVQDILRFPLKSGQISIARAFVFNHPGTEQAPRSAHRPSFIRLQVAASIHHRSSVAISPALKTSRPSDVNSASFNVDCSITSLRTTFFLQTFEISHQASYFQDPHQHFPSSSTSPRHSRYTDAAHVHKMLPVPAKPQESYFRTKIIQKWRCAPTTLHRHPWWWLCAYEPFGG